MANFIIFTAAEETTAVVCACLPVIGPQVYRSFKRTVKGAGSSARYPSHVSVQLRTWHSPDGFHRFDSQNHIATTFPVGVAGHARATKMDENDGFPLQTVVVGGESGDCDGKLYNPPPDGIQQKPDRQDMDGTCQARPPLPGIHVRTDVQVVRSNLQSWNGRP